MTGAGHHVYADKPEAFNQIVIDACNYSDNSNPAILPSGNNSEHREGPESDINRY